MPRLGRGAKRCCMVEWLLEIWRILAEIIEFVILGTEA
jgi:hypothetical protein